jgi:putative alpha-1,2-mannosidase
MKTKTTILAALCALMLTGCNRQPKETPVDHVYMYIGTINPKTRGATPVIKVPYGSVSLFPTFTSIIDSYFADKIHGFPITGVGSAMVSSGDVKIGPTSALNASRFDHDHETATPYYYQVLLEDPDVNTEFTVTSDAVVFRFTLPANQTSNILLTLNGEASANITDNTSIEGTVLGRPGGSRTRPIPAVPTGFYAELSKPFAASGTWQDESIAKGSSSLAATRNSGIWMSYATGAAPETVEMRIAVSPAGVAEAKNLLAAQTGSSFDQIKQKAKDLWNAELSLIEIQGGTEKQRDLFYTTLHRTRALRMGNVWDTYRGAYPLQALIKPQDNARTIQDWLKTYDTSGWLPSSGAMIGHHSTSVIVDSYFRGIRDFDVEKAYEAMKKNHQEGTMIPWKDAMYTTELEQCYFDNGFYPALPVKADYVADADNPRIGRLEKLPYQTRWLPETGVEEWVPEVDAGWHRRQSVSVTLEHAYDDWCLAQMAKALGKTADYELFMKRAHNYQNLYKPELGLMAPKTADGKWVEPFDPKYSGGFAGEGYFAEGNSWIYSWHVQHDVQGLINLMGGRQKFLDKLNELFITSFSMDKLQFFAQMPDMTGLVGMYCHGNEPAFHIPYMFNYAGQPWMTQNKVRQMMELWYDTTPFGLSGDEDGGAMSAWYVMSSLGFYPQCPGNPIYDIGSPLFEKSVIKVGEGKTFTIVANNVSAQNKYIQSATLNGAEHNKPWITHEDMVKGGTLTLEMGPRPNKSWGSDPADAAYSMSAAL